MDEQVRERIRNRANAIRKFKQALIQRLNLPYTPDDLHEDVSLLGAGLGLDSLDALEVVLCIEHVFGVKVPDQNTAVLRSINTIIDYVLSQQGAGGTPG